MRINIVGTVLVMLLAAVAVQGRKETLHIFRDDRPLFHIKSFGFEPKGQMILKLSHFEVHYSSLT